MSDNWSSCDEEELMGLDIDSAHDHSYCSNKSDGDSDSDYDVPLARIKSCSKNYLRNLISNGQEMAYTATTEIGHNNSLSNYEENMAFIDTTEIEINNSCTNELNLDIGEMEVEVLTSGISVENAEILLPLFCEHLPIIDEIYDSEIVIENIDTNLDIDKSDTKSNEPTISNEPIKSNEPTKSNEPSTSTLPDDTMLGDSKRLSRRRLRDMPNWKSNIRKRKKNCGEEYVSATGKVVPKKVIKRAHCRCHFQCQTNISDEEQSLIFRNYWSSDYGRQRDLILSCVVKKSKRRSTTNKQNERRKHTYDYFLPTAKGYQRVCKVFFLGTFGFSEKTVSYTLNRSDTLRCEDGRGKKSASRIPDNTKIHIRNHIKSFPVVASHYCRKSTQRQYLERDLSIRKMYDLYKEKCVAENVITPKFWLYDNIFSTEFNFSFHKPKKDICLQCDSYSKLDQLEKESKRDEFEKHLQRKEKVRDMKAYDKEKAKNNQNIKVINFDLQKVLITPKLEVSDAYYSRKLATYNFSIYDMATNEVSCNMWWETEAKRGSCEIATCIFKYNKSVGEKDEVIYYSDSCTGQQRNLPFAVMCLYSVANLPILQITHNYFERGHSQMEGDSVHAVIERHTKRNEIYYPGDWISAVKNSKVKPPRYEVLELKNDEVLNFKDLADKTVTNRVKDDDGNTVTWMKIHQLQYRKNSLNKIYFKYDMNESDFQSFSIHRGRNTNNTKSVSNTSPKPLYRNKLPISEAKYKDLMSLCKKNVIPRIHHTFYSNLPHASQSSATDSSDCSDSD